MEAKRWGGKREGAGRPQSEHRKKQITVTIPPEVLEKVDNLAQKRNLSRSEALALILLDCDWEQYEDTSTSSAEGPL